MTAIGYVTIGALNGKKSGEFYDAVFGALGSERKVECAATSLSIRRTVAQPPRLIAIKKGATRRQTTAETAVCSR